MMAVEWLFSYAAIGAGVGFLAGLLGVGGGMMLVPILAILFAMQGFPKQTLMQVVLASSMATIVFTSWASVRTHHLQGAVRWPVVWALTPGIILGAFIGTKIVSLISSYFLSIFITLFLFYVATQMLWGFKPKASCDLPQRGLLWLAGMVVGILSSLAGAGGGFFSVPFLTWRNVAMRQAIATSAALGFPIAVFTTLGNLWHGWNAENLPLHTAGFVYLPALICISLASIVTAPFGARLTHRIPVNALKKIFAGLLYGLALRMWWTAAH